MNKTLTLSSIYDSDLDLIGLKAYDVARAYRAYKLVPQSFVISSTLLEEFLEQNNISKEFKKVLLQEDSYDKLKGLLNTAKFSEDQLEELKEMFESMNISNTLVKQNKPRLNLYLSPLFDCDIDIKNEFLLNILSFEDFLLAIKSLWAKIANYNKSLLRNLENNKLAAIIVQRAYNYDFTAEFKTNKDTLQLKLYKGLPDVTQKISKDELKFFLEEISITEQNTTSQEYKLENKETSFALNKVFLKSASTSKKAEEKEIYELVRTIKKIKKSFSSDIQGIFGYKKELKLISLKRIIDYDNLIEPQENLKKDIVKKEQEIQEEFSLTQEQPDPPDYIEEPSEELTALVEEPTLTIEDEEPMVEDSLQETDAEVLEDDANIINLDDTFEEEQSIMEDSLNDVSELPQEDSVELTKEESSEDFLIIEDLEDETDEDIVEVQQDDEDEDFLFTDVVVSDDVLPEEEYVEETQFQEDLNEPELEVVNASKLQEDLEILQKEFDDYINTFYTDSFGYEPNSIEEALHDIDAKHGLKHKAHFITFKNLHDSNISEEDIKDILQKVYEFLGKNGGSNN